MSPGNTECHRVKVQRIQAKGDRRNTVDPAKEHERHTENSTSQMNTGPSASTHGLLDGRLVDEHKCDMRIFKKCFQGEKGRTALQDQFCHANNNKIKVIWKTHYHDTAFTTQKMLVKMFFFKMHC